MNPLSKYLWYGKPGYANMEQMEKNIAHMNRHLKKSIINNLPVLKINGVHLPDGRFAASGDILVRPMDKSKGAIEHFVFVYGTTIDNKELVFEMGPDNDVALIELKTNFIKHHNCKDIAIRPKLVDTPFADILKRVEECEFDTYCWYSKNCEQFVNYCVYGKKKSAQIDLLRGVSQAFAEIYLLKWKLRAINPDNSEYMSYIKGEIARLEKLVSDIKEEP